MTNKPVSQFEGLDTDFLLFTKDFCGYCTAAKNLLKGKELTFTEVNLQDNHDLRAALVEETGHRTVPIIFDLRQGLAFVGGFDELRRAV